MVGYIGNKKNLYVGATKIRKGYIGATKVYASGNTVTYYVDSDEYYTIDIDEGVSAADVNTYSDKFTPTMEGWTFQGWRTDTNALAGVNSGHFMGDDPIVLYAVFSRDITGVFASYKKKESVTGTGYYNQGNYSDVALTTPTGNSYSGWSWRGWAAENDKNANTDVSVTSGNIAYASSSKSSHAFYGLYNKDVVLTYYNDSITPVKDSKTAYYNAVGNALYPQFTFSQVEKYNWKTRGWATGKTANADVAYSTINETTFQNSTTLYGLYYRTVTVTYDGNTAISGSTAVQTGNYAYYNSIGNSLGYTFKLRNNGFTKTNYTFDNWMVGSTSGQQYSAGANVTLVSDTTFYAKWLITNVTVSSTSASFYRNDTSYHIGTDVKGVLYGPIDASEYNGVTVNVLKCNVDVNENYRWATVGIASGTCPDPSDSTTYGDAIFVNTATNGVVTDLVQYNDYVGDISKKTWHYSTSEDQTTQNSWPLTLTLNFAETSGSVYVYIGCTSVSESTPTGEMYIKVDPNIKLIPR